MTKFDMDSTYYAFRNSNKDWLAACWWDIFNEGWYYVEYKMQTSGVWTEEDGFLGEVEFDEDSLEVIDGYANAYDVVWDIFALDENCVEATEEDYKYASDWEYGVWQFAHAIGNVKRDGTGGNLFSAARKLACESADVAEFINEWF